MPELSKPLVDAIERYLSQTPVVTFTYARKATNQLERVFWICFILVMGAFTGQDLVSQFQRYLSEPTTGSVVVMHNTSFSFPNASFCLTINVSRLQYGLDPTNETAVRELLASLEDKYILAYLRKHVSPRAGEETVISNYKNKSFLTKFLEQRLASQNLEPSQEHPFPLIRHRSLLSLTVAMLNSIVRAENTVVNEKLANFTHWGILGPVGKRPGPKLAPRPSTARSIEMVQQFYLQRKIDFTQLMKSVGAAVCSQLQPFIYSKTKNLTTISNLYRLADPCAPDLFRWLGPSPITQVNNKEMFCYALPAKLMNLYTDRDKIVFGFTSSNLYSDPDDNSADDGDNEESAYFNLVDDDNSNKCNIPVRKTSRVDISVHGHFLSVNRRRYPCGEKDLSECRFRCRAKYILRSCGCYPISMEFILGPKPANVPFCGEGMSNHSMAVPFPNENSPACQLIWALLDPDAACVAKCRPACEYMIFQYGWNDQSSEEEFMTFLPADEARNATVFVIRVGKFVYPKVIEDFAMDAKTFTAAIGGVASFWLGLSLVALAHLLAFIVTSILECRNNEVRSEAPFSEHVVRELENRETAKLQPELKRVCGCGRATVTIGEKEYNVFQPSESSSPPVYFRRLGRKALEDNDDFYDKKQQNDGMDSLSAKVQNAARTTELMFLTISSILTPSGIVAILVVISITTLLSRFLRRRPKINKLPGPSGLPLLGYLPWLSAYPYLTFTALGNSYGELFTVPLGIRHLLVLNSYDVIRDAHTNNAAFAGRPNTLSFQGLALSGPSRFAFRTCDAQWKFLRKTSIRALAMVSSSKSSRLEAILQLAANRLSDAFLRHDGDAFDPRIPTFQCVAGVAGCLFYGLEFNPEDPVLLSVVKSAETVAKCLKLGNHIDYLPLGTCLFKSRIKTIVNEMLPLDEVTRQHMQSHRCNDDITNILDALNLLTKEIDDSELNVLNIPRETIKHLSQHLFLAAFATVLETMLWLWNLMAMDKRVQTKVHAELDSVLYEKPPTLRDRERLAYVEATITESHRFVSLMPLSLPHAVAHDTTLRGFDIATGTMVTTNLWGMHHDSNNFKKPMEFWPERFIRPDGSFDGELGSKVLPFSVGKRRCIGESLARQEIFYLFASVLQRFSIDLKDGVQVQDRLQCVPGFNNRRPMAYPLIFRPRRTQPSNCVY